jgi:ribosomal protein L2
MPSSEVRKVPDTAWASIGEVSNEENRLVNIGKPDAADGLVFDQPFEVLP